jgi:hypothetical protein
MHAALNPLGIAGNVSHPFYILVETLEAAF